MPTWLIIVLIVIGALILGYFIFNFIMFIYMGKLLTKPKYKTRQWLIENAHHEEWPGYFDLKKEPFQLKMRDGYIINGDVSLNEKSKKFAIFCHGHGSTREGATKYALIYYKLGYNIIRYDHRGHGDNVRYKCTMGANESKDLAEIVKWVKETYSPEFVVLHGSSMGAATILIATQYFTKDDIKFIVADCPYSSISNFGGDAIKSKHQPRWLLTPLFNFTMRVVFGLKKKDMSPEFYVKLCDIPILFLHGAQDKLIAPYHSDRLFKAKKEPKKQVIFPHGTHANSVFDDPEMYEQTIIDYVKEQEKS